MPAFRAASLRKTPSKTDATAKSRRDWFASRTRPALRRSSSAENSVRVMLTVIDPTPQANQALQGITAPQLCEQLNESAHPTVGIRKGRHSSRRQTSARHVGLSSKRQ